MNVDWLATRGGQLLGCYVLCAMILAFVGSPDKDTGGKLLFLIIGAVLRDMQDTKPEPVPPEKEKKTI